MRAAVKKEKQAMKASDIAMVILIAVISAGLAYWLGGLLIANPDEMFERIDFASEISSEVAAPDDEVFNPYAKNPTVEVFSPEGCEAWQDWDADSGVCVDKQDSEEEDSENPDTPEGEEDSPETE